jgi:hypothetical protein
MYRFVAVHERVEVVQVGAQREPAGELVQDAAACVQGEVGLLFELLRSYPLLCSAKQAATLGLSEPAAADLVPVDLSFCRVPIGYGRGRGSGAENRT